MVGRVFAGLGALFGYFCIATIFAQVICVAYLFAMGRLDKERLVQLAAVVQGVDLLDVRSTVAAAQNDASQEQMAFRNIQEARAVAENDFRLREQSLAKEMQTLKQMREQFARDKADLQRVRQTFEEEIAAIADEALNEGQENVRLILENVKPDQAKDQIMRMVEAGEIAEVVRMLADMPINNKKKIIAEFNDNETDEKTLEEILRLLRDGVPTINVVGQAEIELGLGDTLR